jgi:hemerythrin-like metal-binding protein
MQTIGIGTFMTGGLSDFTIPKVALFGDADIDVEHQYLVDKVLHLRKFVDVEYGGELREHCADLRRELLSHFHNEIRYMKDVSYPAATEHMLHHSEVLEGFDQLMDNISKRGYLLVEDVNNLVSNVVRHMLMEDIAFKTYLIKTGVLKEEVIRMV